MNHKYYQKYITNSTWNMLAFKILWKRLNDVEDTDKFLSFMMMVIWMIILMTPAMISWSWKHWQFWSTSTIMFKMIIMMTLTKISWCWRHWQFLSTIPIMIKMIIMMTKISWCWRHWQFLLPRSENRADGEWENMASSCLINNPLVQ